MDLILGKKNLSELRHLYFKLKDHVFAHERLGFAYNTAALEKILKEEFGTEMIMSDVTFPKYVRMTLTLEMVITECSAFLLICTRHA